MKKQDKQQKSKNSHRPLSTWMYDEIWKKKGTGRDRKMMAKLRILHPVSDKELSGMVKQYRIEQIKLFLRCILISVIFFTAAGIYHLLPREPIVIERNSYGEGDKEEIIYDEEQNPISFRVQEQEYTEEELEQVFQDGFDWARTEMLGDNTKASDVRSSLDFMTEIPGGLKAEWLSDNPDIIREDGTLCNEDWEEGRKELVGVTLLLSYGSKLEKQEFHFTVKSPVWTTSERIRRNIYKVIQSREEKSRTEKSFLLPSSIDGVTIEQNPSGKQMLSFIMLIMVIFGFLFYRKQGVFKEKLEKRQKQILEDYPRIVNQLVLYLGAGMNLKAAFEKIASEHKEEKGNQRQPFRYAYQELYIMMNEMKAGTGEKQAYESYGARMGENCYIKLMALIVQNVQKGNTGLLKALAEEEETAFAKRISQAKKQGEEAGTRLLFPMIILLMVVMVIVMLPAVFQFKTY